jgi:beta-glucosidase
MTGSGGSGIVTVTSGEATCIGVIGELPYAEGVGDSADLALTEKDANMAARLRERCDTVIILIVSGRPLIISDHIDQWDAVVAAWLPGSEGQGVADVLFGDVPFSGKLPVTWPRSIDQLPVGTSDDPLFPFGFGLEYDEP